MRFFLSFLVSVVVLFASDATIDVVKKVDALPSIAVEDASINYDDSFKLQVFKSIIADLNVLSIFNVDRHHRVVSYNDVSVDVANKDMNYVLRYRMSQDDNGALIIAMKLFSKGEEVLSKTYKVSRETLYVFVTHAMAYDINEFMGEPSVEWMKRKVVFSRVVGKMKTELVISDYTLRYQHIMLKGGFNVFPKWANKNQTSFYYTSLDGKPTLKKIDLKTGAITSLLSSDGMLVCSDVSPDGKKLLLTMAPNGQTDVYEYYTTTKKYKRITRYGGIDVSGQYMGDDKIVFVSSRLGYPNIFSKDLKTGEVEQMVYYGKNNSACSVYGDYVVYKARETSNNFSKNTFNLHLISTKTDFIRRLTATGINEYPRFSRDGDAIIFIKNYKNQSALGIMRLKYNKNYLFPLKYGRVQSMDW